jgi:pimeloyl-ACP methyl ester carboxylesterase
MRSEVQPARFREPRVGPVLPALSVRFDVVAVDLPGFGASAPLLYEPRPVALAAAVAGHRRAVAGRRYVRLPTATRFVGRSGITMNPLRGQRSRQL